MIALFDGDDAVILARKEEVLAAAERLSAIYSPIKHLLQQLKIFFIVKILIKFIVCNFKNSLQFFRGIYSTDVFAHYKMLPLMIDQYDSF